MWLIKQNHMELTSSKNWKRMKLIVSERMKKKRNFIKSEFQILFKHRKELLELITLEKQTNLNLQEKNSKLAFKVILNPV